MLSYEELRQEALRLLELLKTNEPVPLTKDCKNLPLAPALYAVRHRELGILYIGRATRLKERFQAGHKAICWAYIDELKAEDVGIAFAILSFPLVRLSLELEHVLLREVRPPYNSQISQEN